MTLEFNDIFAGGAPWTIETQDQGFVEQIGRCGMAELSHRRTAHGRQFSAERSAGLVRVRPADANDRHRGRRPATRQCKDRPCGHAQVKMGAITGRT